MPTIDDSCLVLVDIQGKLAQLMVARESLFRNVRILVQAAHILDIPILWCQQVPKALGPTVPEIAELLSNDRPINKACFSCCREPTFDTRFAEIGRSDVLLCGIETHVCICQTAIDLLARGCDVTVIADAVSSRTAENKEIGLARMAAQGAAIASSEMVLFDLLGTAEHPHFKQIAKLVK